MTVPALLFCCLYASHLSGTIAPKGWHPPEATPAEQAEHDKLAALAARTRLAAQAHQIRRRKWRKLGAPPGSRIFGVAIAGNALPKWYRGTGIHPAAADDLPELVQKADADERPAPRPEGRHPYRDDYLGAVGT